MCARTSESVCVAVCVCADVALSPGFLISGDEAIMFS